MDLCRPRIVEFLLILVFFLVVSSSETNVFNNSSTTEATVNNGSTTMSVFFKNSSTNIVTPPENSSKIIQNLPKNNSTIVQTIPNNVSSETSTVAYIDKERDLENVTRELTYDEIFTKERKCCPLDKRWLGFDYSFTAVCETPQNPLPTITTFERHNDDAGRNAGQHNSFLCEDGDLLSYENLSAWSDGTMKFYDDGEFFTFPPDYKELDYCLEVVNETLVMFRCQLREEQHEKAYMVVKIVTSIFLTGFLVIYMLKPKLHTLHNRCLMRLMICLLGKCLFSIVFQLHCKSIIIQYVTAAGTYFFYMGTFCWSTVICYDIWSGIRMKSVNSLGACGLSVEKKIRHYSKYGWGLASGILFIAMLIEFLTALSPDSFLGRNLVAPAFANTGHSWMGSNNAMYVYFYGPLLTLNAINLIFFISTIRTIVIVRKDNNNVFKKGGCSRRHVQAEMKWFSVFGRLYIVMGITWILDIVSFELSDRSLGYDILLDFIVLFLDIFNICQGILIFFITVFSKEAARSLSKTFSSTMMKARGSLTNSKKVNDSSENRISGKRASSQEKSECMSI